MPEHFCQTPLYAELLERTYGLPTKWMNGVPFHPRRWTDRWAGRYPIRGWESIGAKFIYGTPGHCRLPRYVGYLALVKRFTEHKTWLLDLPYEPTPEIAKALRRADRQGVRVRRIEDINDWRANFLPLVGQRGWLWNNANLLREVQWQFSLGQHAYFLAMEGVEPVGGLGFYWWDGVATEILSRVHPGARHLQVQEPLHVAVFRCAQGLGCHTFDLAGDGSEGIAQFKAKFGGRETRTVTAYA